MARIIQLDRPMQTVMVEFSHHELDVVVNGIERLGDAMVFGLISGEATPEQQATIRFALPIATELHTLLGDAHRDLDAHVGITGTAETPPARLN